MEWLGPTTLVDCGEALGDDDEDSKRLKYNFFQLQLQSFKSIFSLFAQGPLNCEFLHASDSHSSNSIYSNNLISNWMEVASQMESKRWCVI